MKKQILILLIVLLSTVPLLAQYSPCYEAAFAEGEKLYMAGKYSQAKKYFKEAKECPDPNIADANEWIRKCDRAIAEAEKKRLEEDAAKTAYMSIRRIDYCNVERNGQMIDDYGATFYPSKMKCLQPRVTYDALLDETREPLLYIKVKNPNGILVTGKNSPSGYTYSSKVRVIPGKDKTVMLSTWDNNGVSFSSGTYNLEIWYNEEKIYSSLFKVEEDVKEEPEPPVVVVPPAPVEKVAEIKVLGEDGMPLQGAKLSYSGAGRYELTNSEGIGRIDLSKDASVKIEVSHPTYKDKREMWVHVGEELTVTLNQPVSRNQSGIGVVDYIIPGLAQMKTDRIGEGIVFMGGEILLLSSGFISNAIANKQMKVMQNPDVSLADFQDARLKYKTQRAINIISYTSAAIVYAAHLYRTYSLSSKNGSSLSVSPAVMCTGDEMAVGMNINLSF